MTYYVITDRDGNIWNGRHFRRGNPRVLTNRPSPALLAKVGRDYALGPLEVREVVLLFSDGTVSRSTS